MAYQYRVSRCKVVDKEALRRFRKVRRNWINWLRGPIRDEISYMMLDDTLFRTINEARRVAQENPRRSVEFNGIVGRLVDRGYVHIQLMSIRKLVSRRRSDVSLHTLLTDIKRHRNLITREIFVSYDGLPYEFEALQQREIEKQLRKANGRMASWSSPSWGPRAYGAAERHHNQFDRLSGVTAGERQRTDLIQNSNFSSLFGMLRECEKMERVASETIAHIPARKFAGRSEVTLNNIARAQKAICRVAYLIEGPLLYEGSSNIVPLPQFGHLDGFDKAWCTPKAKRTLYEFWQNQTEAVEQWNSGDWP